MGVWVITGAIISPAILPQPMGVGSGILGGMILSVMDYSSLNVYLGIGNKIGIIIGSVLYFAAKSKRYRVISASWMVTKDKSLKGKIKTNFKDPALRVFSFYMLWIGSGVVIVWLLAYWSIYFAIVVSVGYIILFFMYRFLLDRQIL